MSKNSSIIKLIILGVFMIICIRVLLFTVPVLINEYIATENTTGDGFIMVLTIASAVGVCLGLLLIKSKPSLSKAK